MIVVYDGLGTTARARIAGRVLEDDGPVEERVHEGKLRKLRRSFHLLESDEIPGIEVVLTILKKRYLVRTDQEGLFHLELKSPMPPGNHPVQAALNQKRPYRVEEGRLLIWPTGPSTVVISDIDDTVLQTGVGHKLKLLKKVLFSNAHDLKTFQGAPRLYQVWAERGYPVVFVSGSPINLYSRLRRFLALRGFPRAPLLLKNLGLSNGSDSLTEQRQYKLRRIKEVLELFPSSRLILVGDAGEQDPEIYAEVKKQRGEKVVGIMIRRITEKQGQKQRFQGQHLFTSYPQLVRELEKRKLLTATERRWIERHP